jgi:hypothetical protein
LVELKKANFTKQQRKILVQLNSPSKKKLIITDQHKTSHCSDVILWCFLILLKENKGSNVTQDSYVKYTHIFSVFSYGALVCFQCWKQPLIAPPATVCTMYTQQQHFVQFWSSKQQHAAYHPIHTIFVHFCVCIFEKYAEETTEHTQTLPTHHIHHCEHSRLKAWFL